MWPFSKPTPMLTGALPSPITPGVAIAGEIAGGDSTPRPARFSLRDQGKTPPIGIQLIWDCVGWAGAYLAEFHEHEETGVWKDLSGLFIYAIAKLKDGLPSRGTYINNAVDVPCSVGVAESADAPEVYIGTDPVGLPTFNANVMAKALKYKSKSPVMVERGDQKTFEGIKQALWQWKRPIVVGAQWGGNLFPGKNGVLSMPTNSNSPHCTVVVGYDDAIGLLFENSWGATWGDGGFGWFPHGYPVYATAWTSIDLPDNWQAPQPIPVPMPDHPVRDIAAEQRNAVVLQQAIYHAFAPIDSARPYASKNWFLLVDAMTYRGYSTTDLVNYLYAKSHKNQSIFDLSKQRNQ
jgi:hypothetical protein